MKHPRKFWEDPMTDVIERQRYELRPWLEDEAEYDLPDYYAADEAE
jgi:hypothetical protein